MSVVVHVAAGRRRFARRLEVHAEQIFTALRAGRILAAKLSPLPPPEKFAVGNMFSAAIPGA